MCVAEADRVNILEPYKESCPIKQNFIQSKINQSYRLLMKYNKKKRRNLLTLMKQNLISQRECKSCRNHVKWHIRFANKNNYYNAFQNVKTILKQLGRLLIK